MNRIDGIVLKARLLFADIHMRAKGKNNPRLSAFICGSISLFFLSAVASAELVWQQTRLSRGVDVRQGEATFRFRFRNAGKEPVRILDLKTSCSCFDPKTDKREYGPGETGVLSVEAHLNGREGRVDKSVEVITSDRPNKPYKLNLDIRIPVGYRLSSRRLQWSTGSAGSKSCILRNASSTPIKLVATAGSTSKFRVDLKEIRPGFEYELVVAPEEDSGSGRAIISVVTESVDGHEPRTYKIYAMVKSAE